MVRDWRSVVQMFLGDFLPKRIPCRLAAQTVQPKRSLFATTFRRRSTCQSCTWRSRLSCPYLRRVTRQASWWFLASICLMSVCEFSRQCWVDREEVNRKCLRHGSIITVGSERLCSAERCSRLEEVADRQDFDRRWTWRSSVASWKTSPSSSFWEHPAFPCLMRNLERQMHGSLTADVVLPESLGQSMHPQDALPSSRVRSRECFFRHHKAIWIIECSLPPSHASLLRLPQGWEGQDGTGILSGHVLLLLPKVQVPPSALPW